MLLPELSAQTLPISPTLSPTQLDFGSVPVGTTSPPQTVTLSNNNRAGIDVVSITAGGNFSATNNCPATLSASSCNINLVFSPGTIGTQTGTLSVVVDTCPLQTGPSCPQTLTAALTGVGISINAANDTTSTAAGTPVIIDVLSNDDSAGQPPGVGLTLVSVTAPSHGNAAMNGNAITYTPSANFSGTDSFSYTITDSFNQTASATVTVTVNPPGLNAADDTATTTAGTPVTINVLANDTGTGLSITQVSTPSHGSASISGGAITYTPSAGFIGSDSFTYTMTDRFGQPASATVTVTVNPPGLSVADDTATTTAGTPVTINVLANDTGTGLSITQVSTPSHGNASISSGTITQVSRRPATGRAITQVNRRPAGAGGVITYTPNADFTGTDRFSYTVTDSFGQSASATVTVTVMPPALDAVDDTATTQARTSVTINVLANDIGTGLTIAQVGAPAHGSAVAGAGGTITYTPAQNFAGADAFTYTITDGISTDSATVRVTVIAPALDAVNDTITAQSRTPVAIPVLANDVGTGLTITQVSPPAHGAAVAGADGAITYTSAPNFAGADAFTYTITDGISTDTATVTVTVKRSKEDTQNLLEDTTDNPNAKAIGRTIGGLCFDQAASATFLRDCDTLINAASNSEPGVGLALEQITPEALGIAADASQTSVQNQMLSIRSRMASLRTGVMGINLEQLNIQHGGWTLSGRDLRYLLASLGGGGPTADV
ncbi:MAG: Ig-like domain-containing protein, partial [Candidatus Contendobacter sp.]|nr:Ig-like domain-containing protein [Candidatus Contendobacter sp.]